MRRPLLPVAVVLLCAGCSSAGADNGHAGVPASSATEYRAAVRAAVTAVGKKTARIDESVRISDGESEYVLTVKGDFDLARDRGKLAVDFPGGAVSHSDEVFADGRIFVSQPAANQKTWGVMPRGKAEAHYLLRAPLNDPEHFLGQISAMRKVSREGTESIRGQRATHYRGILEHSALTSRMAEDVRKKTDRARDMLGSDLPVFADAWVDGDGRLVQARTTVNMSGADVSVTMRISDFGKPVRVSVPKADETFPMRSATGVLNG
ncbi:LppX_LprAFG lipoprotein [Streptomyces sp. NPDC054842]